MLYQRSLKTHNEGAAIIEFAIVAPVLFLLLIGFIEIGMILFATTVVEGATNIGARIGKTGYTTGGLTPEQYITSRIDQLSAGLLDSSKLKITMQAYADFSTIGNGNPCTPGQAPCPYIPGPGGNGQVVLYRVTYPWALFTPMMAKLMGNGNGIFTISSVATVKNEP